MRSVDEILDVLKEHDALKTGHFVLASGKHSGHYFQVAMLTQHPRVLQDLIRSPLDSWAGNVAVVLSAAVGGIPVGQQVALHVGCRSIFAERNEKNRMILKRSFAIQPGEKILMVEDVITTGGTLDELNPLVEEHGGEIVGVFTVVNRSGKSTWNQLPIASVVACEFPVYDPADCPLCREGVPAHRPGTKKV